jgi:hypothetical protein
MAFGFFSTAKNFNFLLVFANIQHTISNEYPSNSSDARSSQLGRFSGIIESNLGGLAKTLDNWMILI